MSILVTGGAGYIGSHTVLQLLELNYRVVIVDNLINSSKVSIERIEELSQKKIESFYEIDLRNRTELEKVFENHPDIESVIHFAGLKAVGESTQIPLKYYETNIQGTLVLLETMEKYNVKSIVFSSSATVYGTIEDHPADGLDEHLPIGATNPYGRTKVFIEHILKDLHESAPEWRIVILRYFNPVGAHPSGKIGEDPQGIPNNLMPYITQVAIGNRAFLNIFGTDYPTRDGTGVRDYLHVVDLAKGHICALNKIKNERSGFFVYNLGTGRGCSVLEVVEAMKKACGKEIPLKFVNRRPGDVSILFANCSKAERELNWKAEYGIDRICQDSWDWQKSNPNGYK